MEVMPSCKLGQLPEVLVDAVAQSSDYSLMHSTPPHSSLLLEELCDQDVWNVYSSPSTPCGGLIDCLQIKGTVETEDCP